MNSQARSGYAQFLVIPIIVPPNDAVGASPSSNTGNGLARHFPSRLGENFLRNPMYQSGAMTDAK